jgi:hypothetical protein
MEVPPRQPHAHVRYVPQDESMHARYVSHDESAVHPRFLYAGHETAGHHAAHVRYVGQDENAAYHARYNYAGQDENAVPQYKASACETPSSHDVADALARRILAERDEAVRTAQRLREERDDALDRAHNAEAAAGTLEAQLLQASTEFGCERAELIDELEITRDVLADAAGRGERACRRVRELEAVVQHLLMNAPSEAQRTAPPPSAAEEAFGLTRTREAIVKAVHEAAKLPADERAKKLRALRLKWHPDKHDVLKELAEEVTKLINECVTQLDRDAESAAPKPADGGGAAGIEATARE